VPHVPRAASGDVTTEEPATGAENVATAPDPRQQHPGHHAQPASDGRQQPLTALLGRLAGKKTPEGTSNALQGLLDDPVDRAWLR